MNTLALQRQYLEELIHLINIEEKMNDNYTKVRHGIIDRKTTLLKTLDGFNNIKPWDK